MQSATVKRLQLVPGVNWIFMCIASPRRNHDENAEYYLWPIYAPNMSDQQVNSLWKLSEIHEAREEV